MFHLRSFQLFRTQWLGKGKELDTIVTQAVAEVSNYSELNGSVKADIR